MVSKEMCKNSHNIQNALGVTLRGKEDEKY